LELGINLWIYMTQQFAAMDIIYCELSVIESLLLNLKQWFFNCWVIRQKLEFVELSFCRFVTDRKCMGEGIN
jgi:hypothetical protein